MVFLPFSCYVLAGRVYTILSEVVEGFFAVPQARDQQAGGIYIRPVGRRSRGIGRQSTPASGGRAGVAGCSRGGANALCALWEDAGAVS